MMTRYGRIETVRYSTLLAFYVFLVGCSTLNIDPAMSSKTGPSQSWLLRGKLGVRSELGGGSLQIVWRQTIAGLDIHLMGPLGKSVAHIHGTAEQYRVDLPGQEPLHMNTHKRQIEQALGWELPVQEMIYWVRGMPAPGIPHHLVPNNTGKTEKIEQSGWQVDYKKYVQGVPVRITFVKDATVIKLVVKEWQQIDD